MQYAYVLGVEILAKEVEDRNLNGLMRWALLMGAKSGQTQMKRRTNELISEE
jgi:hypothetical protein